jgi:hypothetical protein
MPILPLGSFVVHDDRRAFVETMTGEQQIDDPGQVAVYRKAFQLLRAASLAGPDVVALVQRVAGELRGLDAIIGQPHTRHFRPNRLTIGTFSQLSGTSRNRRGVARESFVGLVWWEGPLVDPVRCPHDLP